MNFIKKIKLGASKRDVEGKGYNYSERLILWKSKKVKWSFLSFEYGIRNSDKNQYFPIWNMSNNTQRSLLLGVGFWFIQFTYNRKKPFNQNRKFPYRKRFWSLYQLLF